MRDQQQMDSIDEIFRQTFGNLPPTPSADGWDTPSDKVWNQVQAAVGHRNSHWSRTRQWVALAALAVTVAAGVYFYGSNMPQQPTQPAMTTTAPEATVATITVPPAANTAVAPANTPAPYAAPSRVAPTPAVAPMEVVRMESEHQEAVLPPNEQPQVAAPQVEPAVPKSNIPNVVERKKEVARIKATIGKWTPVLPAHRKIYPAPAVPPSLKDI